MIPVPPRDDGLAPGHALDVPIPPHQPDVGVVRLGPGAREEDVVQITGGKLGNLGRQSNRGHMRRLEEGVVIGQLLHLPRRDLGQFLPPVADVHAPEPRHPVDDPVAFAVGQPDALAPRDDPRALGRQPRLVGERMEMVRRVQSLQLGRRHMVGDHVHRGDLAESAGPDAPSRQGYDQTRRRSRNLIKLFDASSWFALFPSTLGVWG